MSIPLNIQHNKTTNDLIGQYKWEGKWKQKHIPRNIDTEEGARAYMLTVYFPSLGPTPVALTINGFFERWSLANEIDTASTKKIRGHYAKWIKPFPIANLNLVDDFCSADIVAWLMAIQAADIRGERQKREGKPVKHMLRNTVLSVLNSLQCLVRDIKSLEIQRQRAKVKKFEFAKWPADQALSAKEVHEAVKGGDGKAKPYLTPNQVQTLLASWHLVPYRRAKLWLAFGSGMRSGELSGLRWSDLDLDGVKGEDDYYGIATVSIGNQLDKTTGKPTGCKFGSERVLPLPPVVVEVLRHWHDQEWRHHVGRDPKADDYVFPEEGTGNARVVWHESDMIRTEIRKAGLDDHFISNKRDSEGNKTRFPFDFHATRRTYSTLLKRHCGLSSEDIGALMGHSKGSITDSSYITDNLARLAGAVALLPLLPPKTAKPRLIKAVSTKLLTA